MTIHQPEILEQIFFRLPAKSIGRFRCVSKAWKSLLSQPNFIKTHLNRITQHPIQEQSLILVCDEYLHSVKLDNAHQVFDEMMTPLLPTMLNLGDDHRFSDDHIVDLLASCDGLIVVPDVHNKFVLINPTTREIKALPEPPCELDHHLCRDVFTIPGIGYDSLNDDYKVVTISFYDYIPSDNYEDDDMLVNVYSVKNGTWKTVDDSPYDHEAALYAGGVYLNGCIHWIAKKTLDYSIVIVAFDLKEEKFCEVPHPSSVDGRNFLDGRLLIVEGCLCLSPYWGCREHECFVMKEYGVKESWTRFTIPDHDIFGIRPLCLLGEEQMVLAMNEYGSRVKSVLYNVKERTFKDLKIQGFPDKFIIKGSFVESLLSPHFVYRDQAANEE